MYHHLKGSNVPPLPTKDEDLLGSKTNILRFIVITDNTLNKQVILYNALVQNEFIKFCI